MFNPFKQAEQSQAEQQPSPQESSEVSRAKILKQITHPNRKVIAEDILAGEMTNEELNAKHGYYNVEEMRRTISSLNGNKRVCKTCNVI